MALTVVLTAVLAFSPHEPAMASLGGSAQATGLHAQAPEVTLEVSATGAVSAVQPILDRLTRDPVLGGREVISAEVTTPEAPSGTESATVDERAVPRLLTVDEISARTERIEDGELSAQAQTGEVHAGILGLDVLRVGEVRARSATHPSQDPTAQAQEPGVEFFGRDVAVPVEEPVDIDESLSTADALDALEAAFPGLRSLVQAVGGVFQAGGGVQVQMGRTAEADAATGSATAVGFYASVYLDLDVRICIPDLSGDCLAEVTIVTDTRVLDLVLAQTSVERPERLPVVERINWAIVAPIIAAVALVLFALGLWLGRWRKPAEQPADDGRTHPAGAREPGGGDHPGGSAVPQSASPARRTGRTR